MTTITSSNLGGVHSVLRSRHCVGGPAPSEFMLQKRRRSICNGLTLSCKEISRGGLCNPSPTSPVTSRARMLCRTPPASPGTAHPNIDKFTHQENLDPADVGEDKVLGAHEVPWGAAACAPTLDTQFPLNCGKGRRGAILPGILQSSIGLIPGEDCTGLNKDEVPWKIAAAAPALETQIPGSYSRGRRGGVVLNPGALASLLGNCSLMD